MGWEIAGNIMGPQGPPGSLADAPVVSVFGRLGAIVADPDDYASYYEPLGSAKVFSVFGRAGDISAQASDYASYYPQLSGSYSNPSWISSLAWSKLSGVPSLVNTFNGRSGAVAPAAGDYSSFYASLSGSYADPAWITSLAWSKISGAPATGVSSVFGRSGAVAAASGDYASFYQPLGSYEAPLSFIQSLTRTTNTVRLVGDVADPTTGPDAGTLRYYGIDTSNVRGFYQMPTAPVTTVFGRSGAVVGQAADYSLYYPQLSSSYSNPSWISSLAFGKLTGVPAYEPALGNPAANGYVLSSTTAGVRSWITPPAGTMTFTGDVTGSGTGTVNLQIAANAVGAAEIVANSIGASEINNTQDLGLAALQTIKLSTSATNDRQNVLGLYRNSTGTPLAGFGSRLELGAKSDTVNDRPQVQLASSWVVPTDATRQAKLELLISQGDGLFGTAVMTLWGSKGATLNRTADPGAGWMDVSAGFKVGGTQIGLDDLLATATNDSAASGDIGQIVSSYIASPGSSMSSNVAKNITSISLTAGDWDVRGSVVIVPTNIAANGAEVGQASIGTTSASLNVDGSNQVNGQSNPTAAAQSLAYSMSLPPRRFSLASTTTLYLVAMTGGNAASRTGYGYIEARRVR